MQADSLKNSCRSALSSSATGVLSPALHRQYQRHSSHRFRCTVGEFRAAMFSQLPAAITMVYAAACHSTVSAIDAILTKTPYCVQHAATATGFSQIRLSDLLKLVDSRLFAVALHTTAGFAEYVPIINIERISVEHISRLPAGADGCGADHGNHVSSRARVLIWAVISRQLYQDSPSTIPHKCISQSPASRRCTSPIRW